MKFSLPEYTLEEKYILNEADGDLDSSTFTTAKQFKDYWKNHRGDVDDDFWDNYFSVIFDGDEDLIAELREIEATFIKEVFALGFEEQYNPFITYIKKIWNILGKTQLPTQEIYNTIHNAAANQKLDRLDLIGKGPLELNNIIFKTNFIKDIQDYHTFSYYLNVQASLMKKIGTKLSDEAKDKLKEFSIDAETLNEATITAILKNCDKAALDDLLKILGIEEEETAQNLSQQIQTFILGIFNNEKNTNEIKRSIIKCFLAHLIALHITGEEDQKKWFNNYIKKTGLYSDDEPEAVWPKDYNKDKNKEETAAGVAYKAISIINEESKLSELDVWNKALDETVKAIKKYYKK